MIRYLNDASNSIQYINANGELITRNPFDQDYERISNRLTEIEQNKSAVQSARLNYENAVHDVQRSIDAGRLTVATASLPPVPKCLQYPEDFTLPAFEIPWVPELAKLHDVKTSPSVGFGPDSPARPPVEPKHISALEKLEALMAELAVLAPGLTELLKTLKPPVSK